MHRTLALLLLLGTQIAAADNLTIPNTFTAGTPARAAEVNQNFTAVESSVDDNAVDVNDTAQALATVSSNVDANTTNIAAVTQAVSALASGPNYKFVGFSTATIDGGSGFFGLTAACQADFGPDARLANSQEVIDSTIQPVLTSSGAWVQAVIQFTAGTVRTDVSGFPISTGTHNCVSWGNSSTWGFGVRPNGIMDQLLCSDLHQVACSAP